MIAHSRRSRSLEAAEEMEEAIVIRGGNGDCSCTTCTQHGVAPVCEQLLPGPRAAAAGAQLQRAAATDHRSLPRPLRVRTRSCRSRSAGLGDGRSSGGGGTAARPGRTSSDEGLHLPAAGSMRGRMHVVRNEMLQVVEQQPLQEARWKLNSRLGAMHARASAITARVEDATSRAWRGE